MTEQQRRQMIIEARNKAQQAPQQAPMSDAEAAQIAATTDGLTQEQMVVAAMLGKYINHSLGETRKLSGDGMKIPSVDMSKVMPSGILKNMGITRPVPVAPPAPVPVPEDFDTPITVPTSAPEMMPVDVAPPVMRPIVARTPAPVADSPQMELDFNKAAKYEDIMEAIDKLRDEVKIVHEQLAIVTDYIIKKKPKKPLIDNGNQPG